MSQALNVTQLLVVSSAMGTVATSTLSSRVSISYVMQSRLSTAGLTETSSGTGQLIREYVDTLWSEDWDNEDDAVYDR